MVEIVPARDCHLIPLAATMRHGDTREALALGYDPFSALEVSLQHSERAFTLVAGDTPLAMFGITSDGPLSNRAQVWALTGAGVERHRVSFAKQSRRAVAVLSDVYPVLYNYVDARYGAAIRWVRWLGFEVYDPVPHGPRGALFHPIVFRR